jgi:hypothetical protein
VTLRSIVYEDPVMYEVIALIVESARRTARTAESSAGSLIPTPHREATTPRLNGGCSICMSWSFALERPVAPDA